MSIMKKWFIVLSLMLVTLFYSAGIMAAIEPTYLNFGNAAVTSEDFKWGNGSKNTSELFASMLNKQAAATDPKFKQQAQADMLKTIQSMQGKDLTAVMSPSALEAYRTSITQQLAIASAQKGGGFMQAITNKQQVDTLQKQLNGLNTVIKQQAAIVEKNIKSQQHSIDPVQMQEQECTSAALNGKSSSPQFQKDCGGLGANNALVGAASNETGTMPSFIDVTYLLQHIQEQVPQLVRFIVALSYVSGIAFFFMALMKLKQKGMQTVMSSSSSEGMKAPIVYLFVGSALLYFPSFVHMATNSLMAGGGDSVYGYSTGGMGSTMGYESLFVTMATIVRLVGYISFLRGWYLLAKMGGHSAQPGQLSKGMVHIVGGVLAINIVTSYQIVKATLGLVF